MTERNESYSDYPEDVYDEETCPGCGERVSFMDPQVACARTIWHESCYEESLSQMGAF